MKKLFVLVLVVSWLLAAWPPLWQNPRFPPKIKEAQADTTGAKYPTLGATASEAPWSDNDWTTPTNVYADDAATANVIAASYDSPDQTWVLKATGFDFSAIPDGSTINGVIFKANAWYRSGQGSGSMDLCQLLDTSKAKVGTNNCSTPVALTTTNTTVITKGTSTDLWGNALTAAWIKSANFGVAVGILATAANADVDVDYVTLEVYYTPPAATTTLADGTDPGNSTIAPGASVTDIDAFTFNTDSGTDNITAVTATLSPANSFNNIALVEITDNSNVDECTDIANPSSLTLNFTGCSLAVTTSPTTFKIRVTPKAHADMPAVPGASYATTATVASWTGTNSTHAGTDTDSATITIDNASPANVTSASGTAGIEEVSLTWTNPGDADFHSSVVLRRAGTAVGDTPVEGTTYSIGNPVGPSTVACVGATASCTDTGLTGGTAYHYKIFAKDSNANYSQTGVVPTGSPFTPTAKVISVAVADGIITYGTMTTGEIKTTITLADTQTLTNDGNVSETFNIKGQNTACPWTLAATAGSEQYVHQFCKKTDVACTSPPTDYNALTTGYQTLYTGVAVSGTRQIDLRLIAPTVTSCGSQQNVDVTIQATQ